MKYSMERSLDRWSIYDEEHHKLGTIKQQLFGQFIFLIADKKEQYCLSRVENEITVTYNRTAILKGKISYHDHSQIRLIRMPLIDTVEFNCEEQFWVLKQTPERNIEIYQQDQYLGKLSHMLKIKKILEVESSVDSLWMVFLLFYLGHYMIEDNEISLV